MTEGLDISGRIFIYSNFCRIMDLKQLQKLVIEFRDKRDRKQFHNPKDIATAIAIEAGELEEKFLWKSQQESYNIGRNDLEVSHEAADILNFLLLFADACDIDLEKAFLEKLEYNNVKYDEQKSKWRNDKYNKI